MAKIQKTKYAILGALSFHSMSGYDIKKWTSDVTGSFWCESSGQVYPTLLSLLKDGLVGCDETYSKGMRPKKVYSISKKGQTELKKWLMLPAENPVERNELKLKIFYGNNLSVSECITHLENQKQKMKDKLLRYEFIKQHIKEDHKTDSSSFYWLLTLKGAVQHANVEIVWCNDAIRSLKRKLYETSGLKK